LAVKTVAAKTPMGGAAAALFGIFVDHGNDRTDFFGIVRFLRGS